MSDNISIREFLKNYKNGKYDDYDMKIQLDAGWRDWSCDESLLRDKTDRLVRYLKTIVRSPKINIDTMYLIFMNHRPFNGKQYDDFRIAYLKSDEIIFRITPKSGRQVKYGRSEVWGRENDFSEPMVSGTWDDVRAFFQTPRIR